MIYNTICHATAERQDAAEGLAKEVDLVLVIGGLNSANTKKLARISKEAGTPTYHVEEAKDIDLSWLIGKERVGVTAGASTPDWIIKEVIQKMMEFNEQEEKKTEECTEKCAEECAEKGVEECTEKCAEECAEECTEKCPEECTEESAVDSAEKCSEECSEENNEEGLGEGSNDEAPPEIKVNQEDQEDQEDQEASFAEAFDQGFKRVQAGERIIGVIVKVGDTDVFVDVGGKAEGVIPRSELSTFEAENIHDALKVGDKIEVLVLKSQNDEGHPVLSKRRVDQDINWEKLDQAMETGEFITGKIVEVVKGGLLADVGVRGFIPASLVALGYVEDLKPYIGQELNLKIIECDRVGNKLVLSAKAFLQQEAGKKKKETWEKINEGDTVHGIVRRLTNFGAFIDIGGIDGLLHVSEMAWHRVNHPSDVLKEGDELEVYILSIDREHEKISLGLKQLLPNPWDNVEEKYPIGTIVEAKVVRTAPFGAFLQVELGVEGLVHISQLAYERVGKTEDVVTPGDLVKVKVLGVDTEGKRISLSIKEALEIKPEERKTPDKADNYQDNSYTNQDDEGFGMTIGDRLGKDFGKE